VAALTWLQAKVSKAHHVSCAALNYFFPHVLLLATESEVMDTQAQCQTNASEESYSYMEQCS
jgi:hypothetical protein